MAPQLFLILVAVFHLGITAYGDREAKLKSIHVISDIKYRFATTLISMKYYNPYNAAVTADLHVNMPSKSFISNFSMEIDGNVTVGEVKEKKVAESIFKDSVQKGQGAGIVGVEHRFTNVFDISVNIEPQKYIVYNLTYQELLTRRNSKYEHVIHLTNCGIIDDFLVEMCLREPQDIINLSVSNITDDKATDGVFDGELEYASIDYVSSKEVYIKYNPSRKQQQEISEKDGVAGLLRVKYDVDRKYNPHYIYAVDGYFVHFFTPDYLPRLRKHIIFMFDVSGSMSGTKIEQLKQAMENILDQLDPELDTFNIGKFSSSVSWMKHKFLKARKENINLAKNYIKRSSTMGGTNINDALLESLKKHKVALTKTTKSIVIFLTDGQPTYGEASIKRIKNNIKEVNKETSIFTIGFGDYCDHKFLREIATENGGFNRKIYVDTDSKLQIQNFYKEISNIILKNIAIRYLDDAVNTSDTSFSSYFKGSELVVSGALSHENQQTMNVRTIMINSKGLNTTTEKIDINNFNGDEFSVYDNLPQNPELTSIQSFSKITKKTFVYLTLRHLLKEDRTAQVRKDILHLALKYNFVTPLTSMVVTKSKIKEKHFGEDNEKSGSKQNRNHDRNFHINRSADFSTRDRHFFHRASHYNFQRLLLHRYRSRGRNFHISSNPPTKPPVTTTTAKPLPIIPDVPAIRLKPLNCKRDLCFTDNIQCRNQTNFVLLTDKFASIYIYGHVKNVSGTNCLESLNKVIIRVRNRRSEFTPESFEIKGRMYDATGRKKVALTLKRFLRLTIYFQKTVNSEKFISLHFKVLSNFIKPKGILSDYVNNFSCTEKTTNQTVLSHKAAIFHKVNYKTASGGLNQCFKM